jgi:hypothetical protein
VSVPEAFAIADFDEATLRAEYAKALTLANDPDEQVACTADIQLNVYNDIAMAMGVTL